MRINRSKVVRKCLKFFRLVYHLGAPPDLLLDACFVREALAYKIDLRDRLLRLLQCSDLRLHVLRSALDQLRRDGESSKEAFEFAKSMCAVIEDGDLHGDSVSIKLASFQRKVQEAYMAAADKTKVRRYMVATQDGEVRSILRTIPGVPVLYANKVTLILEPPSEASRRFSAKTIEASKSALRDDEAEVVSKARTQLGKRATADNCIAVDAASAVSEFERRKRKAVSANPNPLSCKPADETSHANKKRRKAQMLGRRG